MKVIFLDIDGVLNSAVYQEECGGREASNVDDTRLPLLNRIVEETGAVIVLSSSWRRLWHSNPALRAPGWKAVGESFARFGVEVFDRTPDYAGNNRDREVRDWLTAHGGEVESFVILDDYGYGWGDLSDRLVQTSYYRGRGLTEDHVKAAIALLGRRE